MILGQIAQRSTLENPSTPLRDAFLDDGAGSFTGRTVNEKTALSYSAFWACVRYLSNSIAMPPLRVMEQRGRERHPARDHRNWSLLHDRPNPEMSSFQLREVGMGHCLTWGNFYCERELDGNGRTVALWPIRPDRVKVVRMGGVKFLAVEMADGTVAKVPPARYLHIAGPGYDGTMGYSVVSQMKQAVGLGLAAEEHGARFYGNGGKIPFVVTSAVSMTPEAQDRWRKQWQHAHGGPGEGLSKTQRVALLDEGMGIKQIGLSLKDNQALETRYFQAEEMARACGVPQHKIQLLQNADFSNIEKQAIEAVTDAIMPWAVRWEQTLNWVLFEERERGRFYTRFALDVLLRGDAQARAEALKIQREWGIINANEWRELEDMNPLEGDEGDTYIWPMNYVPAGSESVREPEPQRSERRAVAAVEPANLRSAKSRAAIHAAYVHLFERAAQHFVTREARAAIRFLKKAFDSEQPLENLIALLDEFYRTFGESVKRELLPVVLAMAQLVRREIEQEVESDVELEAIERFANRYVEDYSDRYIKDSLGQIRKIAQETPSEDLQEALLERFGTWEEARASKIAMNESVRAGNAIALTAYTAAGLVTLFWRTVGENCPLCDYMNGRSVMAGSPFLTTGDVVPGDEETKDFKVKGTRKHPPLHRGCNCVIGS